MTDIGELVAISNINDEKAKCPFCPSKNLDDCKAKKQEPDAEVVSKPDQLGCASITPKVECGFSIAKHHHRENISVPFFSFLMFGAVDGYW